jgi:hypothetical protein
VDEDLEQRLRRALQAPPPPAGFSERVLARLAAAEARARPLAWRASSAPRRWLGFALAASLVLAIALPFAWHREQERAGLRARAQLIEALRVSSQKLDLAYRMVNRPPPADGQDGSGA